jgi:predicted XRE-type DNA-binding protein
MSDVPKHELSSGNVFRDLELPDADELQVKADLVYEISRAIEERGLSQRQAAEILGIDQPKVSALVRGQLKGFSMERLYRFLNALGKDVEIVIRPRDSAGVRVRAPGRMRSVARRSRSRSTERKP